MHLNSSKSMQWSINCAEPHWAFLRGSLDQASEQQIQPVCMSETSLSQPSQGFRKFCTAMDQTTHYQETIPHMQDSEKHSLQINPETVDTGYSTPAASNSGTKWA